MQCNRGMTSSGGDGSDVLADRAAVKNDLIEVRDGAARLKSLLQAQSSPLAELMDGMLNKLSSVLSALDTGSATSAVAGAQSSAAGSADGVVRQTADSPTGWRTRKRSTFSRRSQHPSGSIVTATLDDGNIWRKYGQKEIQNSTHPRSYYRCTHKTDQGCKAKRHVQTCESDPSKYAVTYYGQHTCRDPSTITMMIDTAGAASDHRANNLISFAPDYTNYAIGCASANSSQLVEGGATQQRSSSWGTSDDMFSSSAEQFGQGDELAAVVGSTGRTSSTVGSAPDYGSLRDTDMGGRGGGGAGSLPASPSSLGFVVGSLGDDHFFPFDP